MEDETSQVAVLQAARWYARLRAPDCSAAEREAFQAWLERDDVHVRAYEEAEHAAQRVSQQLLSDPRLRAMAAAALQTGRPTHNVRWRWAAALILSIALGAVTVSRFGSHTDTVAAATHYVNALGKPQQIQLPDGSTVHLDVGSEINVQLSKAERRIELLAGRAFFEVAHDSSRPLSVTARGARTVALGTRFQVALLDETVNVILQQGSVAVVDTSERANWREKLSPGEQLDFNFVTHVREKRTVDAEAMTSWSQKRLIFKGTPLNEALAEVNRYAAVKVRLGDPSLGAIPIGGAFNAGGDSQGLVDALAAVLPVKGVRVGADEIVLFPRYETEAQR